MAQFDRPSRALASGASPTIALAFVAGPTR